MNLLYIKVEYNRASIYWDIYIAHCVILNISHAITHIFYITFYIVKFSSYNMYVPLIEEIMTGDRHRRRCGTEFGHYIKRKVDF